MIFDLRQTGLNRIADGVRETCAESGAAHVYVAGYVVTILREWRNLPSYVGSYDCRVSADHLMSDIAAEVAADARKRAGVMK